MRYIFILTLILSLQVYYSFSQGRPDFENMPAIGTVYGKISAEINSVPIEYANIALFRMKDTSLVNGTISNAKGDFVIEKIKPGMYFVKVQFIGFEEYKSSPFKIMPNAPEVNLGSIKIKASSTLLSEVEVASEKPVMEFTLDKKIVNVDKNIAATGGSAVDIMRTIPSIEVDVDGNVSLRGSTNVNILIDGKPSLLSGASRADMLEQIPSSNIERIEIITNPSVKYDPEGMSGILNIVTKKQKIEGFNGIASVGYGTNNKYNASINLNRRRGKFNLFGSYDFRSDDRQGSRKFDRETYINDTTTYLIQDNINFRHMLSHGVKAGLDFSPNKNNSITLAVNQRFGKRPGNSYATFLTKDYMETPTSYYRRNEVDNSENISTEAQLNYRKTFEKPQKELTADLFFSRRLDNDNEDYFQTELLIPGVSDIVQRSRTNENDIYISAQTDYVMPISEKQKIELGYKGTNSLSDNDYTFENYNGLDWLNDSNLTNNFAYNEQIHAAYGIYSNVFNRLSVQAGLRLEQALTTADQVTMSEKYNNNYFSFFPSAHVSYTLTEKNKMQVSYSRRINRPNMHALNPFIDGSDPNTLRYGNPYLKPEYINSYELGNIYDISKRFTLTSSIFYRQIDGIISRYASVNDDGKFQVTFMNLNKGISYGLEFILFAEIFKWWKINGDFSYYRTEVDAKNLEGQLTNAGYSWNSKINSNMFLPKNFSFQIMGNYMGPGITPQGRRKETYFVDLGLKKDFWKRRASLAIRASDIFNTRAFRIESQDVSYKVNMEFRRESRIVMFTFTYKINEGIKQRERRQSQQDMNFDMDGGL